MKRRKLLALGGLGGLWLALGGHTYLSIQYPLEYKTCPRFKSRSTNLLSSFVAVGDVGTGDNRQYGVAKTMSCFFAANPFPAVLLLGDNIYEHGEIEKIEDTFEIPYRELREQKVKFYAAIGNHDIETKNGEDQIRYAEFNMDGRYYTFERGNVQFFALDTNPEAPWSEQLTWLEKKLAKSQKPWKVVFGHHQMYSSGKYGVNHELIERLTPLFSRYGVQLYLNGHEHHYERTKPIEGTTYLTCGNGAKLRDVGESDWTAYSLSRLGFAVVEVHSDRLEILGVGTNGQIFDRGVISRSLAS
ncbi:metallophosphoesterase [Myxosarcina sp. GI1]|uniref:metallophosphoesterase n=1 Tax=Myxosarcina sp. GI1 TaxID=1541065 RepID=UPI000907D3A9|nr:metallophosphoesterase [Myxosarcina sp. GI1]